MLEDNTLRPVFEELNGTAAVKPFECVGTVEEVQACMEAVEGHAEKVNGILRRFNAEHFLPEKFEQTLKSRLDV